MISPSPGVKGGGASRRQANMPPSRMIEPQSNTRRRLKTVLRVSVPSSFSLTCSYRAGAGRPQFCQRRILREPSGCCTDARRNPIGEWNVLRHVMPRTGVDLPHLREVSRGELSRRSDKSRPQSPVDKGDLALDEATPENIAAVAD